MALHYPPTARYPARKHNTPSRITPVPAQNFVTPLRRRAKHRLALMVITGLCIATASAAPADLVLLHGRIYSGTNGVPDAEAIVVQDGRIVYVGADAIAHSAIGTQTRVIDLKGRRVVPGFQDSHVHPADAPNPETSLDLHGLTTRTAIAQRIRKFAATHPHSPWIVGDGWDKIAFRPNGLPTREFLDSLVPDRPAFLTDNSGHSAWVNSRALAAAHVSADTPDPLDGRIERTPDGQPYGVLHEDAAMDLVTPLLPVISDDEEVANLRHALTHMVQLGVTAVEDAMATPAVIAAYRTLASRGELSVRANLCMPFRPTEDDNAQIEAFIAQRELLPGPRLTANCVKIFLDGAYASHTLALLAPYSDDPRYGSGSLFVDAARLNRIITRLDAEGFQVHLHTQGDGAVRAALNAIESAQLTNGTTDRRHTLAHLCLVDTADVPRFKALNVVANMTPLWSLGDVWEAEDGPRLFGAECSARLLPARELLNAGATLAWGTDWPVTDVSPLAGIETAITHRYPGGVDPKGHPDTTWHPSGRLNLAEAFNAYTAAGAYLLHEDGLRGRIAAGYAADVVVLNRDPFAMPALNIHRIRVDYTIIDGRVVYARPSAKTITPRSPLGQTGN